MEKLKGKTTKIFNTTTNELNLLNENSTLKKNIEKMKNDLLDMNNMKNKLANEKNYLFIEVKDIRFRKSRDHYYHYVSESHVIMITIIF